VSQLLGADPCCGGAAARRDAEQEQQHVANMRRISCPLIILSNAIGLLLRLVAVQRVRKLEQSRRSIVDRSGWR
jgi:hypothetical protein